MKSLFYITATVMAFFVISSAALAQFSGGLGTPDNPWQIANANDLFYLAEHTAYYDDHFILTADINLDPAVTSRPAFSKALIAPDTDPSNGFQGIAFTGTFNGDGHTISNLTINTAGAANDYLGLFGMTYGYSMEVKYLGLENTSITGGNDSDYIGCLCGDNSGDFIFKCNITGSVTCGDNSDYLGGLCGRNNGGVIGNCHVHSSVIAGFSSKNLGGLCGYNFLSGLIVNCHTTDSVTGGDDSQDIGGLCGNNSGGEIIICSSTVTVTGGTGVTKLGGLCGYSDSNSLSAITNCYATGLVTGGNNSQYLGGLCGWIEYSKINNCYATGSITGEDSSRNLGGFCGFNKAGAISNCYAIGLIAGGDSSQYLGGFCGQNYSGGISNCFWNTQTSGMTTSQGGTGKTTAEMQTMSTFTNVGWDFTDSDDDPADWWMADYPKLDWQNSITYSGQPSLVLTINNIGQIQLEVFSRYEETLNWTISGHESCTWITNIFPVNGVSTGPLDKTAVSIDIDATDLSAGLYSCQLSLVSMPRNIQIPLSLYVTPLIGRGIETDPYLIKNFADFQEFTDPCNYSIYWADGVHIRLENDLDLDPALPGRQVYTNAPVAPDTDNSTTWYQGNSYKGVFDGNGYRIVNLTIDTAGIGKDYLGLFGFLENTATVENLGIEGVTITCGDGSDLLAGLCGVNYGSIISCCVNGSITSGSNSTRIGGLSGVSHEQSKIAYCYTNIDLTSGDTTQYLGGLCGKAYHAEILNSYAAGTVFAGTGSSYVGGFCGQYDSGNIAGNFWDTTTSGIADPEVGQPDTDGLMGKTTAEMQQMSTFTGNPANWDFVDETINGVEDHWRMCVDGVDYPRLRWEFTTGDLSCPDGVDLVDVAVMAANWLESDCIAEPAACGYADLDGLGTVDIADLAIMAEYWLEGI